MKVLNAKENLSKKIMKKLQDTFMKTYLGDLYSEKKMVQK